jgi:hypothetical protein
MYEGSNFSTLLPAALLLSFILTLFSGYEVAVFPCGFGLHFSNV